MFTEVIAVYSDITAEYISKFCEQNPGTLKVGANDSYR
jgi:hypothetical protein